MRRHVMITLYIYLQNRCQNSRQWVNCCQQLHKHCLRLRKNWQEARRADLVMQGGRVESEEVAQRDEHLVELAHHLAVGDLKQAFSGIFPKFFKFFICPGLIPACIRIFLVLFFLWKFLFWTLSIFKRGPDIRIVPTLSNFKNVNFIYTNFSRVRLDFIYSNAGWALFHANRSLFRIIWWNWK